MAHFIVLGCIRWLFCMNGKQIRKMLRRKITYFRSNSHFFVLILGQRLNALLDADSKSKRSVRKTVPSGKTSWMLLYGMNLHDKSAYIRNSLHFINSFDNHPFFSFQLLLDFVSYRKPYLFKPLNCAIISNHLMLFG